MRFSEGLFIDTEKTLGELKFAALRRENYAPVSYTHLTLPTILRV